MASLHLHCRRVNQRGRAFTLLELILAMVLMATLLAAVWSVLGIFRDRWQKAQQQTEQSQLIRALQRTVESDLRHCQLPLSPPDRSQHEEGTVPGTPRLFTLAERAGNGAGPAAGDEGESPLPFDELGAPLEGMPGGEAAKVAQLTADVDRIIAGQWSAHDSFFLGTSQAMMFDVIPPALPGVSQPPAVEPSLDTAAIPDVVHRVLYLFTDPSTALVAERPAGLLRCELDPRQTLALTQVTGVQADLVTLIRPELSKQFLPTRPMPAEPGRQPVHAAELVTAAELPHAADMPAKETTSTDDLLSDSLDALNSLPGAPRLPDLSQQLDYLPEVAAFLLRYYDGTTWSADWDSRQHEGQFPVAVELRFQLAAEVWAIAKDSAAQGAPEGDPAGDPTGGMALMNPLAPGNSLQPMDDSLHSAQTQPPEDHRYLIVLRNPPLTSDAEDGGSLAGESSDEVPESSEVPGVPRESNRP